MASITNGKVQYDALDGRYGCKQESMERFFHNAHNLEEEGRSIAVRICNEANFDGERNRERYKKKFDKFLRDNFKNYDKAKKEFVLNWDPRGYCIKIEADDIPYTNIYMDWGRNGILVPADIEINGVIHRVSDNIVNDKFVW